MVGVIKHVLSAHTEVLPASKIILILNVPIEAGKIIELDTRLMYIVVWCSPYIMTQQFKTISASPG